MRSSFLSHADAARRNRNSVLRFLKVHGPLSRTDIWEQMDISRTSVTQVVRQLQENNLIVETDMRESTGGRKPQNIAFNGAAKKLYAFDWDTRTLCLMTLGNTILYEKQLPISSGVTPVAFASVINKEIDGIEGLSLCEADEIIGLGLALPGLIDSRRAVVINSSELGWSNIHIQSMFQQRFPNSVYLERTGNLMALGEHAIGKFKDSEHYQLFILGFNGIGVSTIVHDACQHGANYMYGELGHIKMPVDILCSCGQYGCLEAVVNSLMFQSGGKITDEVIRYLALGISSSINISDTEAAVLVGSYMDMMTEKQKSFLIEQIYQMVISSNIRNLNIQIQNDMKKLTMAGISSYVFDCYFSLD